MSLAQIERTVRRRVFLPPPRLALPDWADKYAVIPKQSGSAEPGRWHTDRAPYQRGIMEAITDPAIQEVVWMKAARVGFTEVVTKAIGCWMDQDPSNILVVQPDQFTSESWSRMYLAPMLDETPKLRGLVKEHAEGGARHGGNTTLRKEFPGGTLVSVWASSANRLRFMTMRRVVFDEIDGYETTKEGDPLELGEKRTETFGRRRKILKGSTPTIKGFSRIEKAFERSDQRYYHVACPDCGHEQRLLWPNLRWDHDGPARYACSACGVLIPHSAKQQMLEGGRWIATHPGRPVAGFHLSALYSPWVAWDFMRDKWLAAQESREQLQAFFNTFLGESWEVRGEGMATDSLLARREEYAAPVPRGVGVLTSATDVHHDRLEVQVEGWGAGWENWKIAHHVILGDPTLEETWTIHDDYIKQTWRHESGQLLTIRCATVDSGDQTQLVYAYTAPRYRRRVFAVKGGSKGLGKGLVRPRPTVDDKSGARFFIFSPNTAKDTVFSLLRVQIPGPRYVHFPEWVTKDWVDQLTSEKVHYRPMADGSTKKEYKKPPGVRNEALDLSTMNLVALALCGVPIDRLGQEATRWNTPPVPGAPPIAVATRDPFDPPPERDDARASYITNWR